MFAFFSVFSVFLSPLTVSMLPVTEISMSLASIPEGQPLRRHCLLSRSIQSSGMARFSRVRAQCRQRSFEELVHFFMQGGEFREDPIFLWLSYNSHSLACSVGRTGVPPVRFFSPRQLRRLPYINYNPELRFVKEGASGVPTGTLRRMGRHGSGEKSIK